MRKTTLFTKRFSTTLYYYLHRWQNANIYLAYRQNFKYYKIVKAFKNNQVRNNNKHENLIHRNTKMKQNLILIFQTYQQQA